MPFKSQALTLVAGAHAKHPGIAKRFEEETPRGAKLPYHVGDGLKHLFPRKKGK